VHLLWLVFLPALAYQYLALIAEALYLARRYAKAPASADTQGVSVLKPLRGLDPNTYAAFVSQIQQDYPEFEVLFGAASADDPAAAEVRRLQQEFPAAPVRLIIGGRAAPNAKVGLLEELASQARYPLLVINDSDIKVTPGYLAEVISPLDDPAIGIVTCPYRVKAHNLPAAWEALGITTDFMPSTLVAQTIGVREFGFGSTLAFRAADLDAIGGFAAVSSYLADDYQLAKRISRLNKRALLSTYVVETSLGDDTWAGGWRHQLRWARTIRFSKGGGYAGLFITHAGVWVLLAIALGAWLPALALVTVRILSAFVSSSLVIGSTQATALCWLAPVWDLYSFAIWLASYAGNRVRWRDRLLEIDSEGRIKPC
jgi:ceramide glucosyltransferase